MPQYEPNPRIKSVQYTGHRCYTCVEARRRAIRWRWMLPPVREEDRKKSERERQVLNAYVMLMMEGEFALGVLRGILSVCLWGRGCAHTGSRASPCEAFSLLFERALAMLAHAIRWR